jgi:hypothetical protein
MLYLHPLSGMHTCKSDKAVNKSLFITVLFFCQQQKGFYICTPAPSGAEAKICSLKY